MQLKDPVCGMTVTAQSAHQAEHAGKRYYFCSAGCLNKFNEDPAKFAKKIEKVMSFSSFAAR